MVLFLGKRTVFFYVLLALCDACPGSFFGEELFFPKKVCMGVFSKSKTVSEIRTTSFRPFLTRFNKDFSLFFSFLGALDFKIIFPEIPRFRPNLCVI